jgi:hypothetical protein
MEPNTEYRAGLQIWRFGKLSDTAGAAALFMTCGCTIQIPLMLHSLCSDLAKETWCHHTACAGMGLRGSASAGLRSD